MEVVLKYLIFNQMSISSGLLKVNLKNQRLETLHMMFTHMNKKICLFHNS